MAVSNDDALDVAFGTAVEVTDSGGTTNDLYISDETSALTVGGTPAAEDYVVFQVYRDAADGADTMTVDSTLLGIKVHYTINAGNDS